MAYFVVRVHTDDPLEARQVAWSVERELRERGARGRVETAARGRPGASAAVGVLDGEGHRWVAPIELPPEKGSATLVRYLESWGFIARPRV